jgi:hypothetical protein
LSFSFIIQIFMLILGFYNVKRVWYIFLLCCTRMLHCRCKNSFTGHLIHCIFYIVLCQYVW